MTKVGSIKFSSTLDSNNSSNSLPPIFAISSALIELLCSKTRSASFAFLNFDRLILSSPQDIFNESLISSHAFLIMLSVNSMVFSKVVKAS